MARGDGSHFFEDPHEPPALVGVAFFGVGAVTLEVDVVDEGIDAIGGGGDFVVVGLDSGAVSGRGGLEDFREGGSGFVGDEFGLEGDVFGEPGAEGGELWFVEVTLEGGFVGPWAVGEATDGGDVVASLEGKADELGPGFGVGAVVVFGVPDEVADAHGGEFFAFVPVGEAGDFSAGFVLPDFFADGGFLRGGEVE